METAVESYAAQPAVGAPIGLRQLRVLQFAQHLAGDPARAAVEHYIRARFADDLRAVFGCEPRTLAPVQLAAAIFFVASGDRGIEA